MKKIELLKELCSASSNIHQYLSALELAQASGLDIDDLRAPCRADDAGPCLARFLDLNLDMYQVVDEKGWTIMDEMLHPIIRKLLCCDDNKKGAFYNENTVSFANQVLTQLHPDMDMGELKSLKELRIELQESPNSDLHKDCLGCHGLRNWIVKYVTYRKLRNWQLDRSFETTAPACKAYRKEVESIDFFGVDEDTDNPWSPFKAKGVRLVLDDWSTITVGASGPVIPVCDDDLEDEDTDGEELNWQGMQQLPNKLISCRYSYYPLKSIKPDTERICFVTRLTFCTHMLIIKAVKSFWKPTEDGNLPLDREEPVDSDNYLQCVVEPFNGTDYDYFWDQHPECF